MNRTELKLALNKREEVYYFVFRLFPVAFSLEEKKLVFKVCVNIFLKVPMTYLTMFSV